jgi:hypothetical protein
MEKFLFGSCFAFGIIVLIIVPIALFSDLNPTMLGNPIHDGDLFISFELNNQGKAYEIYQS